MTKMAAVSFNYHGFYFPLLLTLLIMATMVPNSTLAATFALSYCSNSSSKYTTKSSFATNLNTLLNSLTTNAATNPSGFNTTSVGESDTDDVVYGLLLCRGDQSTSGCSNCVATAAREQPERITCPKAKAGILWYDQCMVRYDGQPFAGILDQSVPLRWLYNNANVSGDQQAFLVLLGNTMNKLAAQASNSPVATGKKYANIKVDWSGSLQSLYGMVQCTPDLSTNDCNRCLISGINQLTVASQGLDVLQPNCLVRYEIYPFLDTPYNSSFAATAPAPAPSPPSPPPASAPSGKKKVSSTVIIIAIVVPAAVIAVTLLVVGIRLIFKKTKKYDVVAVQTGEDISMVQSLQYDLGTLEYATNNFSPENKVGEGGFGSVYKGKLKNGEEIAVKKLSKSSSQGVQEFKNEVLVVAKLQHRNLVRLLGFCLAGEEKLLVYEYVANKSLDNFLFEPEKQSQLDWRRRYKIIEGIARGLLYLHQDSQLRIIHRDLKASNILLDENMDAKISDFGMAKIFGVDQTQGNTSRIVGTYGYMSPEYAMQGQFSVKSDVYSFGVLVLEIISGQRNINFCQTGAKDLFSFAWKNWRDGSPLNFVDPTIRDSCSANEVMRCLHLGLSCVQESVSARPTMATVVLALDSHSVTLVAPVEPITFSNVWTDPSKAGNEDSSDQSSRPLWSVNDVSITELDPR